MPSVLVVDDDLMVLGVVAGMLRAAGYNVVEARGGQEALSLVHTGCRPDAMVTDVQMPMMGGRETADEVRRVIPGLPVIFVSGFVNDDVLMARVEAGEETLLMKPAALAQIAGVLAEKIAC